VHHDPDPAHAATSRPSATASCTSIEAAAAPRRTERKNSTLPAGPRTGEAIIPCGANPASAAAAITSDHRDAFYLWWVFVRGATPEAAFEALAAAGGA